MHIGNTFGKWQEALDPNGLMKGIRTSSTLSKDLWKAPDITDYITIIVLTIA